MAYCCFNQGCEHEAQYFCLCLSFKRLYCEFHLQKHLKLSNKIHDFDSILTEPSEKTNYTTLEFLTIEKLKKEKLKTIILTSFNKKWSNIIEESLTKVDTDLIKISYLIEKFSQVSEGGPIINLLISPDDIEVKRAEEMLPNGLGLYTRFKLFYRTSQLRKKKYEILSKANNDPETEQDFRRICDLYTSQALVQTYQEFISAYQKITSTYLSDNESNLYVYDSESESEEVKVLEYGKNLKYIKLITQLPNGELFCIGKNKTYDDFAFIIDRNYQERELSILSSKQSLTALYFNRSIYWFGHNNNSYRGLYLTQRFDLDENRWIELAQKFVDRNIYECWDSIVFNSNILISKHDSCNLLLYSIDIDSFSEIPYEFENDIRKILINAEKRLYLIECKEGWIYESEVDNEYAWNNIGKSIILFDADQVYCSYNKGGIYISIAVQNAREYFKFDLSKKSLIKIA